MPSAITLRPPTFSSTPQPKDRSNPSIPWLAEAWHITHSTLPMWKSKRNVRITYTPLPPSAESIAAENTDRIDDLVTYQTLKSDKVQSVKGLDKAVESKDGKEGRGEWDWRGRGWLAIAGSHWEILGWGEEDSGNKWIVSMFAKTLFTPAGIDVYSLREEGVSGETLEGIKEALQAIEDEGVKKLAGEVFEIQRGGQTA